MAILSRLKRALTRKTDVVTFDRLDYWTMLELFDRIPLYDLVRLNGLASWWSGYVHKVCRTKRSISVHCGYKTDQFITGGDSKDKVKVVTIDSTTSDRLGQLLPKVTTLEVIIGGSQPFTLSDVTYLISQWSHQLVDLKLKFDSTFESVEVSNYGNDQFYGLLLSLNRITTLRELTIRSESDQCRLKDPIDMPIFAQLDCFYIRTGKDDLASLRDTLVQYAVANFASKQIDLLPVQGFDRMQNGLEFLEPQPISKYRTLRILNAPQNEWAILAKLVTLHVGLRQNSESHFMEHISKIQPRVRTLSLTFCISTGFDRNSGQVRTNPRPLKSVTKLELNVVAKEMKTNSYSAFKSLKANLKMFPKVKAVHLEFCHLYSSTGPTGPLKGFFSKIWRKISMPILYRKLKRRVRQDFPGVKCSFEQRDYDLRD